MKKKFWISLEVASHTVHPGFTRPPFPDLKWPALSTHVSVLQQALYLTNTQQCSSGLSKRIYEDCLDESRASHSGNYHPVPPSRLAANGNFEQCSLQPCPERYSLPPTQSQWQKINALTNEGVAATPCTESNARKLREAHPPSTPPSQEQAGSNVTDSPETPHKAYQSAPTSPSGRVGNRVRFTDANDDDDDQVEEEEVAQALNPQPTPQTFQALHTALSTVSTDTYAQRLKGYPTPAPVSAYTTRPIRPPLHTTRESEGTSDLPRSEQTPPKSQPTSLTSPHPNTTGTLDLTMNNETLIQLLQEQQRTTQRIQEALDKLTNKTASSRSPVKEPEPFKGHPSDTHRFLQYFSNWASANPELKGDGKKWISAALSYFQGNAASWAVQYLDQIAKHEAATDADKAKNPWPFKGEWSEFVVAFCKRFQPADQEKAAEAELEALKQGSQSASQFAAKFQEVFPRTGLSEKDGIARFRRKLNERDRTLLDFRIVAKDQKPTTLQEYCDIVNENDFTFHGTHTSFLTPSTSTRAAPARDPYAMDIDATRTGPNGRSREEYLQAMRGRCFGCGSTAHVKKDGNHGSLRCNYCHRMGHSEKVCQDRFMGYPPGRGPTVQRRRIAATSEATFSLFDDSPTPTATIAAVTPAPPAATSSSVSLADLLVAQKNQQDILERLENIQQKGF
ncbi:hypothetical protein CC2G_011305 [Coprinopsis cinerea AmutBmut pab1-1]|nr:hypothetical protein CC2G_011305 [Coprinopsis cinerea AmutBmut pab1-1]